MSEDVARLHQPAAEVSEQALARAEEMIEREEGVQNRLSGGLAAFVAAWGLHARAALRPAAGLGLAPECWPR